MKVFKGRLHGVYTSWVPTVWGHQKQTDCPVTPQLSLKVLCWHLPEKRASCGDGRPPSNKSDPFRMMSWNEKNMSRQSDSRYHGPFGCWWVVNLETHPIYISLPTKEHLAIRARQLDSSLAVNIPHFQLILLSKIRIVHQKSLPKCREIRKKWGDSPYPSVGA